MCNSNTQSVSGKKTAIIPNTLAADACEMLLYRNDESRTLWSKSGHELKTKWGVAFGIVGLMASSLPLQLPDFLLQIVKANMKSYIQLETAAIFFLANLFLKQGIG